MSSHAPKETRINTVTVTCATTGPEVDDIEGNPYKPYILADVRAWCERLTALGAGDDLVIDQASGLVVTLNLAGG